MMRRYFMVRRCFMMRCCFMMGCFTAMHYAAVRPAVAIIVAVSKMSVLGLIAAPSMIVASMAMIDEAMFAPAVGVAPAGPRAHAQEDAVIEVIRPIEALGRAAVRPSLVIAPVANGWLADFDGNLRANLWRYGQARKQCCRAE
jgi:hypothetical protein